MEKNPNTKEAAKVVEFCFFFPVHSFSNDHFMCQLCFLFWFLGSSNVGDTLPTGQLSNIPWRRAGVKYTNNEAYFDVVEEIDAIIDKSGNCVHIVLLGKKQFSRHKLNRKLKSIGSVISAERCSFSNGLKICLFCTEVTYNFHNHQLRNAKPL